MPQAAGLGAVKWALAVLAAWASHQRIGNAGVVESPGRPIAPSAPAMVLHLLVRVPGIPATEAPALRSRGEDDRRDQRTTSAFVPWPPRETP